MRARGRRDATKYGDHSTGDTEKVGARERNGTGQQDIGLTTRQPREEVNKEASALYYMQLNIW